MKHTVSPEIGSNPILASLVSAAERILEFVLGPSADEMRVVWTLADRKAAGGAPPVHLHLEDANGSSQATFTLAELEDSNRLRERYEDLWDDLLLHGPQSGIMRVLPAHFRQVQPGTWCG